MKLYQHFKGGLYIVTCEEAIDTTNGSEHSDTRVTYCSCVDGAVFSREHWEFHENVEHEGKTGPRFRFIADPADIMPEGGHP